MHGFPFDLVDGVIFLATAGFLAPLLHRFRLSPVLTFLIVGAIVGPEGVRRFAEEGSWIRSLTIANVEPAEQLAEIGVVLLLFLTGLEVSGRRLWSMRRLVFGLGGAQIVLSTGLLAAGALAFGVRGPEAFVIGAALALSSTAIVLELLTERRQLGGPTGRATLAVLLTQDLAVAPLLILMVILGSGQEPAAIPALLGEALLLAVAAIAGIMLAGRAVRPFLRAVAARGSPDMFVAAVLLLIVATGAITLKAHLSVALGAFLAGLLLAETEFRHSIEAMLAPFKGLLLGVFFFAVGMRLDLSRAIMEPLVLLGGIALMLTVKPLVVAGVARLLRVRWPAAIESSLLLAPGGEFAFVMLGSARQFDVIGADAAAAAGLIAGGSMFLTPVLAGPARRLAAAVERRTQGGGPPEEGLDDLSEHVVVVGYGRVGRLLGDLLCEAGAPMVALDQRAEVVGELRKRGAAVFYGDARHVEILRRLAAERAVALVVTMDDPRSVDAVVITARRAWPDLPIYARARDSAHAARLAALGARRVTPEALEASLDLAQAVLTGVGLDEEAARTIVDARRRQELEKIASAPRPEEEAAP